MLFCSSISTIGRLGQSDTIAIGLCDHDPVALRTESIISADEDVVFEVFVAANTRPLPSDCNDFKFMWSSAVPPPDKACSPALQVASAAPSWWTENHMAYLELPWLLHMMPSLFPPKASN